MVALVLALSLPALACGGTSSVPSGDTGPSAPSSSTSSSTTATPTSATPISATPTVPPTSGDASDGTEPELAPVGPISFVLASMCLPPGAASTVEVHNAGSTAAMVSSGAYLMRNQRAAYLVLGTTEYGFPYDIDLESGATTSMPPIVNSIPAGGTIAIQFHAPAVTGEYVLVGFGAANSMAVSVSPSCATPASG